MAKAMRYRANGKYLRNTLFATTNGDFIGAYHGVPTDAIYDPTLAAEEEALTIESHKRDFSAAFGIPADQIEAVVIPWDGVAPLPAEDEVGAHERLPIAPAEPQAPTLEQKVAALIAAQSVDAQTAYATALKSG